MPLLTEILRFLAAHAPLELAEKWDNVGLLVGDRQAEITRALTCLTLTPDVAREAIQSRANLIVSHHPVLFKPVQKLTADDSQGRMLLDLIAARVAVFSAHTAYDSAAEGINQQLAGLLGLADARPLRPQQAEPNFQIVVFVPPEHLEPVQKALWGAGAGEIGDYAECSYYVQGTGTFRGSQASHPTIGKPGEFEHVSELRLEVRCPRSRVPLAVRELIEAHPYEEPAYFIYPLDVEPGRLGSGRWGRLPEPLSLAAFVDLVKQRLGLPRLQYAGDPERPIQTVAIACGSGGEFLADAVRQGCQALVTGEARFHSLLEARAANTAIVLGGHYATERPAMEQLAARLSRQFPGLTAFASQAETDPLQWV